MAQRTLKWVPYDEQKDSWPGGRHIIAQHDEDSVVVYQAYNKNIAEYAAKNKKFDGAPGFSTTRMTWIKPQFLWMMYRAGWGGKDKNQTNVLAIWLRKDAFLGYLRSSVQSSFKPGQFATREEWQKAISTGKGGGCVRLQWDPDHTPDGAKVPSRRAVQLGLKGMTSFMDGEDILDIQDISEQVLEQSKFVSAYATEGLSTPLETLLDLSDDPQLEQVLRIEEEKPVVAEQQAARAEGKARRAAKREAKKKKKQEAGEEDSSEGEEGSDGGEPEGATGEAGPKETTE
eukprot:TRINITY_DN68050_c10_g1_i6.p1 TRINITY_DN68050_c10_g1~~TRINITY_DN68050_c10_g1_i6.p1  ORF type:complete len:287 (-),score=35.52 TRINITY_DN68050_c10_g1_i6:99-959(-)